MEIPLFPLPNLVLFPNVILPLHIFEERYKHMINECIDRSETFGILCIRSNAQEETDQTIHRTGTTARVIQVERIDGGRLNIMCQGEARFRVSRFVQNAPYWKAAVEFVEDRESETEKVGLLAEEVASLYRKAFELGVQLNAVTSADLQLPESPVELSFMVSYVLDVDAEEKQKLLEMTSTTQRLRTLVGMIDETIHKLERQIAYKEIAHKVRGNGDLGKPGSH